jgi:hypothetical protein
MKGILAKSRPDGLAIFLDVVDPWLDNIRATADRETVIMAVALRRAQQIAINYSVRYAPDLVEKTKQNVAKLLPPEAGPVPSLVSPERGIDTSFSPKVRLMLSSESLDPIKDSGFCREHGLSGCSDCLKLQEAWRVIQRS